MHHIIWYRYEERHYAPPVDEFDNVCGPGRTEVVLLEFPVIGVTRKGVRLSTGRFVLLNAHKRYACPTESEARESFLARKRAQIRILKARLTRAESSISLMEPRAIHVNPADRSSPIIGHRARYVRTITYPVSLDLGGNPPCDLV